MDQLLPIFNTLWVIIVRILNEFWWILLPVVLFNIFVELYKSYTKELKKKEFKPVYFELKFSEEASMKPLQFMELFFSNIKNIKLADDQNISFEIVGIDNQLKYFIRLPEKIKDLVTITLHAQYPDINLIPGEDYFLRVSPNVPNNEYSFWAKEFKYKKANPFPILTYDNFYNNKDKMRKTISEASSYDPLSVIIELFNSMKREDIVCLQIMIRNFNDEEKAAWELESKTLYNPLVGKEAPKKPAPASSAFSKTLTEFFNGVIPLIVYPPEVKKEEKPKTSTEIEKEAVKLIENKINNSNYVTNLRLSYVSTKKDFNDFIPSTFEMFIKQYNTSFANSFEEIKDPRKWYKNWVKLRDKFFPQISNRLTHLMFEKTVGRKKAEKGFVMSAKELTSLFHFPFQNVYISSVVMEKNKKGAPPPNLPFIQNVEEEETDI